MPSTFSNSLRRARPVALLATIFVLLAAKVLLSVDEKKLAIFVSGKAYSVAVTDSRNMEYVALSEVLQPLGKLSLRAEGRTLRLRFNDIEGEFAEGKKLA